MIRYPIYFTNKTCPHCGAHPIGYLNNLNRITKTEDIYPVKYYICNNCGRKFYIHWIKGEDDSFISTTMSKSDIKDFEDEVTKYAITKRRSL